MWFANSQTKNSHHQKSSCQVWIDYDFDKIDLLDMGDATGSSLVLQNMNSDYLVKKRWKSKMVSFGRLINYVVLHK